jgi:transcriptional regulator with XRE-family HTH domain
VEQDRRIEIGKRVAAIRTHRNYSQAELAAAIHTSSSTIQHIEHGRSDTRPARLEALAKALHCSVADLLAPLDAPMPRVKFRGGTKKAGPPPSLLSVAAVILQREKERMHLDPAERIADHLERLAPRHLERSAGKPPHLLH